MILLNIQMSFNNRFWIKNVELVRTMKQNMEIKILSQIRASHMMITYEGQREHLTGSLRLKKMASDIQIGITKAGNSAAARINGIDDKYQISNKFKLAGKAIISRTREFNEHYHITETIKNTAQKGFDTINDADKKYH
ncbi:MAG: hypothetical protein EZS28_054904, partial [Streblomastix strix]